jgi:predicted nucleic acid-binding protein
MIVLDVSAAIELLLGGSRGQALHERIRTESDAATMSLHAPHLIDVEVAHVLRKLNLRRIISDVRVGQALADFDGLGIVRHEHDIFLPRIWALRATFTVYDAAYVALAETLSASLITLDRKLARASGHRARIEVL